MEIIESSEKDVEIIDNKIVHFNDTHLKAEQGKKSIIKKNYCIKDNGEAIAGINAIIYYECIFVDVLFVDEKYRGKDLGSKLLEKAEYEAKKMGVKIAHLDTFDFQAKDFYLKNGYEIYGILENSPKQGHKRYYLKKDL